MKNNDNFNNLDEYFREHRELIFKEDDEFYASVDTTEHTMSVDFEKKLRKKIRKKLARESRPSFSRLEKVAAFAVAVSVTLILSAMFTDAARSAFGEVVADWLGIAYSVSYEGIDDVTRMIEEKKEPTYLPAEYEKTVLMDTPFTYYLKYAVDGEKVLTYSQDSVPASLMLDGDDCTSSYVYVGDYKAFLIEYTDGRVAIVWSDMVYYYYIFGHDASITSNEMIKIAESTK